MLPMLISWIDVRKKNEIYKYLNHLNTFSDYSAVSWFVLDHLIFFIMFVISSTFVSLKLIETNRTKSLPIFLLICVHNQWSRTWIFRAYQEIKLWNIWLKNIPLQLEVFWWQNTVGVLYFLVLRKLYGHNDSFIIKKYIYYCTFLIHQKIEMIVAH